MARQVKQAIDLAVSERSSRAGGRAIEHISLDDGDAEGGDWSAQKERENAQNAANDPSVIAYLGPYNSGAVGVALPITNRANLLQIGPSATWPGLTTSGWNPGEPGVYFPVSPRNFARLAPPDSREAEAAALWAKAEGARSIMILDDGSSYSKGLGKTFKNAAGREGLETRGPETLDPLVSDLETLLGNGKPAAVYYAPSAAGQAASAARAIHDAQIDIPIYASDTALSDQFLEQAGKFAGNWHVTFNGAEQPGSAPGWDAFANAFKQRYGSEPSLVAARAFDGANIVLDAVASGATTREQVLEKVLGKDKYLGASGEITFDANGDNVVWQITGYMVEDGKFAQKQVFNGGH